MPWIRALVWLALLAPFFFASYGWANSYASRLSHVSSIGFEWERHVPFLAWTILPYWSSDLLYAGSLFVCRTRQELDRHALRLLAIQLFSIACFVAFPLRCTFERPPVSGWEALLFDSLLSFDRPFNQAPSLHVSITVILWARYRRHAPRALGAWFVLVGLSAWTTYQHHFLDLVTGLWAGILMLAAIPEHRVVESRRPGLTLFYFGGALLLTIAAFEWRGTAWLLLWPAFALSLVAAAYWTGDSAWLGKRVGRMPWWIWPYTLGARINAILWTRGQQPRNLLADDVWIGRTGAMRSVIDLTAELPSPSGAVNIPILDLTTPTADQLTAAVEAIEAAPRPVLVCCALGYSRSAVAGAAWLLSTGRAATVEEAVTQVRRARPQVVLHPPAIERLQQWVHHHNGVC